MLDFHTPTKFDFDKIYSIYNQNNIFDSGYTITTILGWQSVFDPKVAFGDGFCILRLCYLNTFHYISPLATNKASFVNAINVLLNEGVTKIEMANAEQSAYLVEIGFIATPNRDMFEYLYNSNDLITLSGKKYHAKRNFINSFEYPYNFRAYTPKDFDVISHLMEKWHEKHLEENNTDDISWSFIASIPISDYELELNVLQKCLSNLDDYKLFADVLEVNGEIIGFSAGEIVTNDLCVMYFEKADITYKGVYALLDHLTIQKHCNNVKFINKQEDMGISGLRQSKLSYHPCMLLERNTLIKEQIND